jgi:putative redox protein
LAEPKPTVAVDLEWQGGLRFAGTCGSVELALDSPSGPGSVSPVQALAFALAGCMAMDVAAILTKSRLTVSSLRVRLDAERAAEEPRRLVGAALHFAVTGDVPPDRMDRALALSRDKYCSVWNSLRSDMELRTSYTIEAAVDGSDPGS